MTTRTETITITASDVIYVARQLQQDIWQIRNSYPRLVSEKEGYNLINAIMKFIENNSVRKIGFSIYDPLNNNLVYHEWIYVVLRGDALPEEIRGTRQGEGGKTVIPVSNLPYSAKFSSWVFWSNEFLQLTSEEQKSVIENTGWELPGKNSFKRRYHDSTGWVEEGYYVSNQIGVQLQTYRLDF